MISPVSTKGKPASCQVSLSCDMALTTLILLSVVVMVEGSTTQWNTGYNDSSSCSKTWFFTRQFDNGSTACECGSDLGYAISCDEASGRVELLEKLLHV